MLRGTDKESDDDLLSQARCLLSLARERFTVLFGMGRGGSTLLWSSDKGVRIEAGLYSRPGSESRIRIVWGADCLATLSRLNWKKVLGCNCIAHTHTVLLLKIIGSSLTGN